MIVLDDFEGGMLLRWGLDLGAGEAAIEAAPVDPRILSDADRAAILARNADIRAAVNEAVTVAHSPLTDASDEMRALVALCAATADADQVAMVAARWGYDTGVTTDPAAVARLSMPDLKPYQFDAVLDLGGLRATADAAVEAITDPVERIVARSRMEKSQAYARLDPLFTVLVAASGVPLAQVDILWMWAADL